MNKENDGEQKNKVDLSTFMLEKGCTLYGMREALLEAVTNLFNYLALRHEGGYDHAINGGVEAFCKEVKCRLELAAAINSEETRDAE